MSGSPCDGYVNSTNPNPNPNPRRLRPPHSHPHPEHCALPRRHPCRHARPGPRNFFTPRARLFTRTARLSTPRAPLFTPTARLLTPRLSAVGAPFTDSGLFTAGGALCLGARRGEQPDVGCPGVAVRTAAEARGCRVRPRRRRGSRGARGRLGLARASGRALLTAIRGWAPHRPRPCGGSFPRASSASTMPGPRQERPKEGGAPQRVVR